MNGRPLAALPDPIDAAIAAAAATPAPPVMEEILVNLSSGRQAILVVPPDLTDPEILDLVSGLSTQLRIQSHQVRAADPRSRILVPK